MIRSTKASLMFANNRKKEDLCSFIDEYCSVVFKFIDKLWLMDKVPKFVSLEIIKSIRTWLGTRALQCAGKQAIDIIRGCRAKQGHRLWKINELKESGQFKKARKLQKIYDETLVSKPNISEIEPELDGRFIKNIDLDNKTSFDGWIVLWCLGNKLNIKLPFKKHKHFNKMLDKGKLRPGIRLSKKNITFHFELPDPKSIKIGKILGVDIGQNTILSCSDGQTIDKDPHGHNYRSICERLTRKKKGSKGFRRTQTHRTNYINWSVKQLNLKGIKQINREDIKDLRRGVRYNRLMQHWNYAELFEKLDSRLIDAGVQINKLSPTYTSQRCSACGWVRKGNRKKKWFKCDKCGFEHDADLNASTNLSLWLLPISKQQRLSKINKTGFYWPLMSQEPIVPDTQKINNNGNISFKNNYVQDHE